MFSDMLARLPMSLQKEIKRGPATSLKERQKDVRKACAARDAYDGIGKLMSAHYGSMTDYQREQCRHQCCRHGRLCPVFEKPSTGRLLFHSAGLVCRDFSTAGMRMGMAGPSALLFKAWKHETIMMNPAFILTECAESPDLPTVSSEFPERYVWATVVLDPTWFGCPARRVRRFCFAYDSSVVAMTEPLTTAGLLHLFGRSIAATPDVFLGAREEDVIDRLRKLCHKHYIHVSEETLAKFARGEVLQSPECCMSSLQDLMEIVSPGKARRAKGYQQLQKSGSDSNAKDPFYADLSQNPLERPRIGKSNLPTLTTRAEFAAQHLGREVLLQEHFIAQGVRGFKSSCPFQVPFIDLIADEFSDQDLRTLAGNGQNICCVIPLHLFIYGHARWLGASVAERVTDSGAEIDMDSIV